MNKKMSVWLSRGELREIENQLRQFHVRHSVHRLPIQPKEGFYCGHYKSKDLRNVIRLAKKIDKFCCKFNNTLENQLEFRVSTEGMRYMRDIMSVYDEELESKIEGYKDNDLDYGDRKGLKKQIRRAEKILYKLPSYGKITDVEVGR